MSFDATFWVGLSFLIFVAVMVFKFKVHRRTVGDVHRHPYAGGRDGDVRSVQYLAALVNHLLLFPGVAAVQEAVDVRKYIKADLLSQGIRRCLAAVQQGAALVA